MMHSTGKSVLPFQDDLDDEDLDDDLADDLAEDFADEPLNESSVPGVSEVGELDEFDEDPLLDPEDLEFDEPEYQPDTETEKVARLVQQLSQGSSQNLVQEEPLSASPTENLLPQENQEIKPEDYLVLPDDPRYSHPASSEAVRPGEASSEENAFPETAEVEDGSVYLELERLLAETGKLTEAIAVCNRAIQENPNNAKAYDRLGWACVPAGVPG
ncbi:tetratricopeptide repeat protein [Kovacikia minuta CCNUW1]|uniref:tetratricopeptide repeat protein n=1 Tax=Kovacikia minuta TaxID=2931930 RepID=UPI001CCE1E17|nr:tetratricopeptide repeat protein [Kovacikia minuta]UBF27763.1 tetratricopeptide repeat protein [Kovacikia minuta CCNUW1]